MDNRRRSPSAVSWSHLPPDILSRIVKCLKCRVDFFRFLSVCKNWRLSQNPNPNLLSSFLPRKISNPTLPFSNGRDDPLILVARTVFLVRPLSEYMYIPSSRYWILNVEEMEPGKLRILYPLSKDRATHLSSNFPKFLDLMGFDVSEISKGYGLRFASDESDVCGVHKVLLCSDGCTNMVLYGKGTLVGVRMQNGNWGYVRQSLVTSFSDVIIFKETLYAVDCTGNVHIIDHRTIKVMNTIAAKLSHYNLSHRERLVELYGKLSLVYCSECNQPGSNVRRVYFQVLSLNEGQCTWDSIIRSESSTSSLYISLDSCFHFSGLSDFVVYSEECFDSFTTRLHHEHKLFGKTSVDLQHYVDFFSINTQKEALSFIARILWPPPAWFWPDTYSANGDDESEELDLCNQHIPTFDKVVLPPSMVVESQIPTMDHIPLMINDLQDCEQASRTTDFDHGASGTILEGLNIKSNLMPTLQKI